MGKIFNFYKKIFLDFISEEDLLLQRLEKEPEDYWQTFCLPKETHGVLTFFSYESPSIKKAIWEIKYKNNSYFKEILGRLAGEELTREFEDTVAFLPEDGLLLIPIPNHKNKKKEKGFNQSEELLKILSANFPLKHQLSLYLLQKIKDTKPQATLKRTERLQNMKNAFAVLKPEVVKNKVIILFDDVVTTGSTLHEAKRILVESGAKEVHMVALSRGG